MKESAMDEIFKRVSVRQYTDEPVSPQQIEQLLRAGMQAPSAMNQQPWEFVVVDDPAQLSRIRELHPYATSLATAPVCIVVLARQDVGLPGMYQQDLGACAENIMLEAVSQSLGCCWMGVMGNPIHEGIFEEPLNLPASVKPFCLLAVGHPAAAKEQTPRFDPSRIHHNTY
jgi:nitroreductase